MNIVIVDFFQKFSHNKDKIHQMQKQAFQFYNVHFSKKHANKKMGSH
jgi:hypothetical protein